MCFNSYNYRATVLNIRPLSLNCAIKFNLQIISTLLKSRKLHNLYFHLRFKVGSRLPFVYKANFLITEQVSNFSSGEVITRKISVRSVMGRSHEPYR